MKGRTVSGYSEVEDCYYSLEGSERQEGGPS